MVPRAVDLPLERLLNTLRKLEMSVQVAQAVAHLHSHLDPAVDPATGEPTGILLHRDIKCAQHFAHWLRCDLLCEQVQTSYFEGPVVPANRRLFSQTWACRRGIVRARSVHKMALCNTSRLSCTLQVVGLS